MSEVRVTNEKTGGEKGQKPQRMDLLPFDVLMKDVSPLYAYGAKKYADHNWRKGYAWSLSIGALGRHFAQFAQGEDYDFDVLDEDGNVVLEGTGEAHLASVVFHALTLLHFMRYHRDLDDRWTPAALEPAPEPEPEAVVETREEQKARLIAASEQATPLRPCPFTTLARLNGGACSQAHCFEVGYEACRPSCVEAEGLGDDAA